MWTVQGQWGGVGGQAPGAKKTHLPPPTPPRPDWFSLVFQGDRFREVLGKAEECSTGPMGRGHEGSTASQGFHCVLPAPAGPTAAQSLGSSQKNKKTREGKDRRATLVGTEPGRGGGEEAPYAKSQGPGWEGGRPCTRVPLSTPVSFNSARDGRA